MGIGRLIVVAAATVAGTLAAPAAEAAVTPLPLTCGTQITQTGSYRATTSVHDCANTVIVDIAANDVTLDLNGHMVDGDDTNCSEGIAVAPGITNATILDGSARDCTVGVNADDSGIGALVKNVVASSNASTGILLEDGSSAINNIATGNGSYGIRGDENNTFRRNTVSGNVFGLRGDSDNIVVGNTLVGNGDGIDVLDDNQVTNNVIRSNGDGITVSGTNRVIENTVTSTGGAGISADHTLVARRNVLKKNRHDGISANSNASVVGNVTNENGDDGIDVGSNSTVKNNKANSNFEWGIIAATPVAGAGTNTANNNGEPDQCDPVNLC